MWTYPEWSYCRNVPSCLACPILGTCPRRQGGNVGTGGNGGGGGGRSCRCNGFVATNGNGQCRTRFGRRRRNYCYVDSNCRQSERERSTTQTGRGTWYSYAACNGRQPRVDDDFDGGPLWRSHDDDEESDDGDDLEDGPDLLRTHDIDEDNEAVDETNVEVIEEITDA